MPKLPKRFIHKKIVDENLNDMIRALFKVNPTESPEDIIEFIYNDNKDLDGLTKKYIYDILDFDNKVLCEQRRRDLNKNKDLR